MDDSFSPPDRKDPEQLGPLVAPAIIVCLLILGGIYFFLHYQAHLRAERAEIQSSS